MHKPRRILFPTDFSEFSKEAQGLVIDLAQGFRARVYLLHVFEFPYFSHMGVSAGVQSDVYQWIHNLREYEKHRLKQLGLKFQGKGIKVITLFREGKASIEIIKAIRGFQTDLAILGTHGRTGVRHAFMGSVAETVVRKAPCPVLTVKPFVIKGKKK